MDELAYDNEHKNVGGITIIEVLILNIYCASDGRKYIDGYNLIEAYNMIKNWGSRKYSHYPNEDYYFYEITDEHIVDYIKELSNDTKRVKLNYVMVDEMMYPLLKQDDYLLNRAIALESMDQDKRNSALNLEKELHNCSDIVFHLKMVQDKIMQSIARFCRAFNSTILDEKEKNIIRFLFEMYMSEINVRDYRENNLKGMENSLKKTKGY